LGQSRWNGDGLTIFGAAGFVEGRIVAILGAAGFVVGAAGN
jgi:hypothetical protein